MTVARRTWVRGTHILWVLPWLAVGWAAPRPAYAGDHIVEIAKDALYGGATGLLLGGVLALVVDSDSRDDVIRWGVVIGTFAGFGYGVYETHGSSDEFSDRVRRRSEERRLAAAARDPVSRSEAGALAIDGRDVRRTTLFLGAACPPCRMSGERPEPATGGATGRKSW